MGKRSQQQGSPLTTPKQTPKANGKFSSRRTLEAPRLRAHKPRGKGSQQQGSRVTTPKKIPKASCKSSSGRTLGAPRLRAHKPREQARLGGKPQGKPHEKAGVKKQKSGRHAWGSRVGERARKREEWQAAQNLQTDRLRFAAEDYSSNLVRLLHAAEDNARKSDKEANEQTQEEAEQKDAMQQLRCSQSVQTGLVHCARARLPLARVCGHIENAEESADLRCAAAAVKDLTRNMCRILKLGASDTYLVLGTALRVVELLLDASEGLPRHAFAAQRRLYRSSPTSPWALAVFQTTLAVGPQRELTGHEWKDVRSLVPDSGVRQAAKIQCCMLNAIYMASPSSE
jgi:hypothetical protein